MHEIMATEKVAAGQVDETGLPIRPCGRARMDLTLPLPVPLLLLLLTISVYVGRPPLALKGTRGRVAEAGRGGNTGGRRGAPRTRQRTCQRDAWEQTDV